MLSGCSLSRKKVNLSSWRISDTAETICLGLSNPTSFNIFFNIDSMVKRNLKIHPNLPRLRYNTKNILSA